MIARIGLSLLVLGIAAAAWFGPELLLSMRIGTGFVARQVCSCVFVAERSLDSCRADMLPQTDAVNVEVLADGVRSSLPLLETRTARYRPGLGCTLLP